MTRPIHSILLVDDSDDDEFFLRRSMQRAGITCPMLRLSGGQEAIDYFARVGIYQDQAKFPATDLVFLDINMPLVSGFDVLAWLQAHDVQPMPFIVVMLSSSDYPSDLLKAKELGALSYLSKPPKPELFSQLATHYSLEWVPAPAGKS